MKEETLQALKEADIDEKMAEFIHQMLVSAMHLYGYIPLNAFWEIFRTYRKDIKQLKLPVFHKRHLLSYVRIAGEEDGILVTTTNEITGDTESDNFVFLMTKELEGGEEDRFFFVRGLLLVQRSDLPRYLPETLDEYLSYNRDPVQAKGSDRLLQYVEQITGNRTEAERIVSEIGTDTIVELPLEETLSKIIVELKQLHRTVNTSQLKKYALRYAKALRIWTNLGWTMHELSTNAPLKSYKPMVLLSDEQVRQFAANGISYDEIVKIGQEYGVDTDMTYNDLPKQ